MGKLEGWFSKCLQASVPRSAPLHLSLDFLLCLPQAQKVRHQVLNPAGESPSSTWHLHSRSLELGKTVALMGTEEPRGLRLVAPQAAHPGELVWRVLGSEGCTNPEKGRRAGPGGEMREEEKA